MLSLAEFILMVGIDFFFIAILILVMMPLGMYRSAAFAVMKRNFVGYFSNPTGYVFLCLFVLLTAFAAFWPHEFFTANLANFDQLNKFLPYIMLIFIPAITMSIWAEERRQGTDELLLTFPATDYDIVIGKYFAAVLVFTVSLLFSQLSNYAVLIAMTGGDLDTGLLFSTYLGYWFIGVAMLAIGMVASFLTSNLTIGFIFGAVFNAPLAFFSNADVIVSSNRVVNILFEWSLLQRFEPFGRGLISMPSIVYFVGLVLLGVYLSLVLIGRRHWLGGRDGSSMLGHYALRTICLVAAIIGTVLLVQYSPLNRIRLDVSRAKVSTLSPDTREKLELLAGGSDQGTDVITIDAYISDNIPTNYVLTKYEIINLLREFDAIGGNQIKVNLHDGISPFSTEAINAEKRYGIRPVPVPVTARGTQRTEGIILGAAFTSGLNRLVIPFFNYGMPVEYELLRSIRSLNKSQRKTIGVLTTDVLPNGPNPLNIPVRTQEGSVRIIQIPSLQIIQELEKQYNVEFVDPKTLDDLWLVDDDGNKIARRYDALLVLQPSKMASVGMDNLIAALESGQPAVIFEDPKPSSFTAPTFAIAQGQQQRLPDQRYLSGTALPRALPQILPQMESTEADIDKLYNSLGIRTNGIPYDPTQQGNLKFFPSVVIQKSNPYPRDKSLGGNEVVIIKEENRDVDVRFDHEDPATKDLNEVCFMMPGSIVSVRDVGTDVVPLVMTGKNAWLWSEADQASGRADTSSEKADVRYLAVRVNGRNKNSKEDFNVVYVADLDLLNDNFVRLRDQPFNVELGIEYTFQNVGFVMNLIDSVTQESSYFNIRNRRIRHATLKKVEEKTNEAWAKFDTLRDDIQIGQQTLQSEEINKAQKETSKLESEIAQLQAKRKRGESINNSLLERKENLLKQIRQEQRQRISLVMEQKQNEDRERVRAIYLDAELNIQKAQQKFKLGAVTFPAIPPLLVGLIVFVRRRLKERAGISKARRLK
jgi:ABC-2 type transport system permease protein